jgi:septal ring factor EnvC (AmiA/AmiB activator)
MRPLLRSLCLLALALPALAQEVKQWTNEQISKEMSELDRRLKNLERHLKPTDRRLAELEEQLRAVRGKVDMMELTLKNLEGTIQALRKEVAALAGRTEAIESKPPLKAVVPPASEKGKPVPPDLGTIRSQKVSMEADAITITGVVANTGDKPLVFVIVQADLLDKDGKVVKTEAVYTEPRVIPAGSTATFHLKAPRDPRVQDHRLSLRTE